MILALLIAAATPQSAVEAERAFAAAAQTDGQWTAFRAFAAPDGVMFTPQQVNAQEWLKGRADPPQSVMWWPAEAWVSCDGTTALTTGPWLRGGGKSAGYFTTVWRRQPDGSWKWLLDHGGALAQPRRAGDAPKVRRASCKGLPTVKKVEGVRGYETGSSPDGSLVWNWNVYENGARIVWAELWDGSSHRKVLEDHAE
jgi:ketosteroid isomerase-like protein